MREQGRRPFHLPVQLPAPAPSILTHLSPEPSSSGGQAAFPFPAPARGEVKVPGVFISLTLLVATQTDKEHHFSSLASPTQAPD